MTNDIFTEKLPGDTMNLVNRLSVDVLEQLGEYNLDRGETLTVLSIAIARILAVDDSVVNPTTIDWDTDRYHMKIIHEKKDFAANIFASTTKAN